MRGIKFTQKAMKEHKLFERLLRAWLSYSDMTKLDLFEHKTDEKIFVEHEPEGRRLMCIRNGKKEQIGCGLHCESSEDAKLLFMYIGALLDCENDFKTHFSNEIIETLG